MTTTTTLKVSGMSCNHCVNSIEGALGKVSGVQETKVNLHAGEVTVSFEEGTVGLPTIIETIEDQGYDVAKG